MVEELKLAIKIDDATIEQSLLKQFANAQKMADKVVLDFKNVNFDDKQIEAKFKEMQKKAGQNPIDLTIGGNTLDMLGQIDKRLAEILSIGKGKSFIDSSSTVADIGKIENKINELNKKYEAMQKKLSSVGSGGISGKDVSLVDNTEFQKLTKDVENTKTEINVLKENIASLFEGMNNDERVVDRMDEDFQDMSLTIDNLIDKINSLQEELNIISSIPSHESNISSGKKFQDFQKEQANYEESVNKVNSAIQKTDKILDTLPLHDKLDSQFLDMIDSVDNLNSKLKSGELTLSEYKNEVKSLTSEYSKMIDIQQKRDIEEYNAAANLRKTKTNQFKKIDDKFGKYSKQYTSLENSPAGYQHNDKYKAELEEYNNQLNAIKVKIQAIKDQDIDVVDQKDLSELDEMYAKLDKINASLSHTPATQKGSTKESRQKVFNMINELKQFTGMAKESKLELEAMEQRFKSFGTNLNVSEAISEVKAFKSQLVATNQTTKNLLDTVKEKAWYGWAAQLAGMFSFYDVINGFRQVTSTVIDLNTQITELAKVSEQSSKQIYDDFSSYADIAKEVRGTISDTIVATADWSKNGYSIPDSKQLAEVSQLYKNVGDGINIDEANKSLISTLQGFKLEADQAEHIVDVFNEVSNNEAISSGGIGDALQRSAASFNAASTSLEKSVSLVTATNSVLQDPEKVGNMWKTVSARIRGAKTELKEAGEDTDGMVESTAKLQALIKGMTGFDIMESDGKTFKDIYDIIIGIGEKWNDLSDINRASLLEKLAGKNQSNALAAALNNIDVLKKSYGEAMNAQGSAREENEEYAKSIQASIDLTKAKLEELSADLLSSDFLKDAIDAGGKFIDVLDGIVKSGSAIPAVATAISAALSFKNVGRVKIVALM